VVEKDDKIWKKFLKKHWQMLALFIAIGVIAFAGAIYVFLWFVEAAQPEIIPVLLGVWSMGHIITFILHLIFWEFVYVGIPLIIVIAVIYFGWWKKLPEAERKEYNEKELFGHRSNRSDAGGFFSFLIFIFFCIKVWLDNQWEVPISTWEFDYLVSTCIWAIIVIALIIGIPVLIGGSAWLYYQMKK